MTSIRSILDQGMPRALAVLLAVGLLLAGCGDDSGGAGDAGTGDTGDGDGDTDDGDGDRDSATDASMPDTDAGAPDPSAFGGGICDLDAACEFSCDTGCKVECLGGLCSAECDDGGCALDADFGASADYNSAGGGCLVDCDGTSLCELDCPAGGCEVECSGASTCILHCGDDGDACAMTCADGSRGTCEGNCALEGCDLSCDPDPSYAPVIDPDRFSSVVDNPLFPLPIGGKWVYEGEDEVITVEVLAEPRSVMGVEALVVHDRVATPEGELIEDTYDWYAQDADGNVWYMGEETEEYVGGVVASTAGSWEAGVDGAIAGIIMEAAPKVGDVYRQEYLACEAEDMGEVVEVGVSVTVPIGSYEDCVVIRDYSPLDPAANEHKTYCPGVGVVQVLDLISGEVVETLTELTLP